MKFFNINLITKIIHEKLKNEKNANLSSEVAEQLKKGNKIEAIKMLRKETGMDLKQAKELVDNVLAERNLEERPNKNQNNILVSNNVLQFLIKGKKIDAIRTLRIETGIGLKDAKDAVEKYLIENPGIKLRYGAESKRGVSRFFLLLLAIIVILIVVYYNF